MADTDKRDRVAMLTKAMRKAEFDARPAGPPRRSHFHKTGITRSKSKKDAIRDSLDSG